MVLGKYLQDYYEGNSLFYVYFCYEFCFFRNRVFFIIIGLFYFQIWVVFIFVLFCVVSVLVSFFYFVEGELLWRGGRNIGFGFGRLNFECRIYYLLIIDILEKLFNFFNIQYKY